MTGETYEIFVPADDSQELLAMLGVGLKIELKSIINIEGSTERITEMCRIYKDFEKQLKLLWQID